MKIKMNDLVLAELDRLHAEAAARTERLRADARGLPTLIGHSNRQLLLQRKIKEQLNQAQTWHRLILLAQAEVDRADDA